MAKSDYAENGTLDFWLGGAAAPARPTSHTVKLFTTNPTDAGGGTEVSTADWTNYTAQTVTFGAASGGTASNSAEVDFGTATTTSDVILTGFGVYDHLDNLLYWAAFSSSQIVQNGNPVKFAVNDLDITED